MECLQVAEQSVVLLYRLGKSESRIHDYVVDSRHAEYVDSACKLGKHIAGDIAIVGELLHSCRSSACVHQHVGNLELRDGRGHVIVEQTSRNVVYHVGSQLLHGL